MTSIIDKIGKLDDDDQQLVQFGEQIAVFYPTDITRAELKRFAESHERLLAAACVMEIVSREFKEPERLVIAHDELAIAIEACEKE